MNEQTLLSDHLREEIKRAWTLAVKESDSVYDFQAKTIRKNIRKMERAYKRALRVERRERRAA